MTILIILGAVVYLLLGFLVAPVMLRFGILGMRYDGDEFSAGYVVLFWPAFAFILIVGAVFWLPVVALGKAARYFRR